MNENNKNNGDNKNDENENLFLKIINKELPADIVYEDEQLVAFRDIQPAAPLHLLLVPRKHIRTTDDIREEDAPLISHMILTAQKLAREHGVSESGYRLQFNCKGDGGQVVYHLHLHLIGGKKLPNYNT